MNSRFASKVVWQMTDDPEVNILLERVPFEYDGPVAMAKPKASQAETDAFTNAAKDRAGRDANIAATQADVTGQENDLSFYTGDPTKSPLTKSYINSATTSVNSAYNNAAANTKQSANAAGFGYAQPVTQGANAEVEGQRASTLAAVPQEALMRTVDANQRAAGLRANLAQIRSGQSGYYDPTGYFKTGAGLQQNRENNAFGFSKVLSGLSQLPVSYSKSGGFGFGA